MCQGQARRRGDRERESGVFLSLSFEIGTLLEDCLRVRKSGAIRVLVALVVKVKPSSYSPQKYKIAPL